MKRILALSIFVLSSLSGAAQHEPLLPIREYVLPNFYNLGSTTCAGCGQNLRIRYQYDGVDFRRADLAPYIRASGDPEALRALQRFERQQRAAVALGATGGVLLVVGAVVLIDYQRQPATIQLGSGGMPFVDDDRSARTGGVAAFVAGGLMATAAVLLRGASHESFHRSVQFYNRSIGRVQLSGTPFVHPRASGIGLALRF